MVSDTIVAVARSGEHSFTKEVVAEIRLVPGLGVEGDAHAGTTVQHRSRVARDPAQPNLRQVHLLHAELLDELAVPPGALGENVTTRGLDLLGLPTGALLRLGAEAVVEVTGLRNPCAQLDAYRPGLQRAMLGRAPDGSLVRRCGIMGIVRTGGLVRAGDRIVAERPAVHRPLEVV